jgi:hypothetical protein
MKGKARALTVALISMLAVSQAQADGVLAPGKPAGIKEAQRRARGPNLLLIGGAAAVAVIGVAIAVAQSNDAACGSACDTTTTTTGT